MQPDVLWPLLVPVHSHSSYFFKIRFNIKLLSTPTSSSSVCPSGVPSNRSSPLSQSCRVFRPFHFSWFNYPNHIWWGVKTRSYSLGDFLYSPFTCFFLGWNIFIGTLFSKILRLCSFHNMRGQASHTYLTRCISEFSVFYSFCSYGSNGKTKILDRMQ